MASIESLPPSLTTPLSQQEQLPIGLPPQWPAFTLEDQRLYLRHKGPLMRLDTFVAAGLEVGTRRLDEFSNTEQKNQQALHGVLGSPEVYDAFRAGNQDYVAPEEFLHWPYENKGGDPLNGRGLTGSAQQKKHAAVLIAHHFGKEFVSEPYMFAAFGLNRCTGKEMGPGARLYRSSIFRSIEAAEWSISLRAMAGLQMQHQAAAKAIRTLIKPLIEDEPPYPAPGREQDFWRARVAGTDPATGIAYPAGFRAKSGPELQDAMQQEWGEDCNRNRIVFTSLLNMRSGRDAEEGKVIGYHIRNPVCKNIARGDFDKALARLQSGMDSHPHIFSWLSRIQLAQKDFSGTDPINSGPY